MLPDLLRFGLFCSVAVVTSAGSVPADSQWTPTRSTRNQPRWIRISAGSRLMLECGVDPHPPGVKWTHPPQVAWIKVTDCKILVRFNSINLIQFNQGDGELMGTGGGIRNFLVLDRISVIQQGNYTCTVNSVASIEFRIEILPVVGEIPNVKVANVSGSIGGTVRMHCGVRIGSILKLPELHIEWLREIRTQNDNSGRIHPNASVIILSTQFQS